MTLLIVLLSLVLLLAVLFVIPRGESRRSRGVRNANIDEDELLEAEEELRHLDVTVTPEEAAEELPDWGPGVPRIRKDSDRNPE